MLETVNGLDVATIVVVLAHFAVAYRWSGKVDARLNAIEERQKEGVK